METGNNHNWIEWEEKEDYYEIQETNGIATITIDYAHSWPELVNKLNQLKTDGFKVEVYRED